MAMIMKANKSVVVALLVLVCCLQQIQVSFQQPSGNDLFNRAVSGVITIANELGKAFDNPCPENCDENCSQDLCGPLPDNSSPICFPKARNETILFNCTNQNQEQSCISVRVTSDKSSVTYVRDTRNPHTASTISQRSAVCRTFGLDDTFTQVSKKFGPYFGQYYVGTIDGTLRTFPGREDGSDNCVVYDSRKRPWYNGAIFCPNHLVILLDHGRNMNEDASSGLGGDLLDYAKKFASSLMETVYADSYVNFFAFGGGSNVTYNESVQVQFNSSDPQRHAELDFLKSQINSTTLDVSTDTEPDDVVRALEATLKAFQEEKSGNLLQNVILLTDGVFTSTINYADSSVTAVITQLKSLNVRLFIYGISNTYDDGLTILSEKVNGSYRNIHNVEDFSDPLVSLGSYFSYLATCHRNMYDDPFWSRNYKDYFNVGDIVTVASPAFTAGNSFVGVAAIDVILDELGPMGSLVRNDFLNAVNRQQSNQSAVAVHGLSQTNSSEPFDDSTCLSSYDSSYPLCKPGSDSGVPNNQRICCDSCAVDSSNTNSTSNNLGKILGSVLGSVLGLLALIGAVILSRTFWTDHPDDRKQGTGDDRTQGTGDDRTQGTGDGRTQGTESDRWAQPVLVVPIMNK